MTWKDVKKKGKGKRAKLTGMLTDDLIADIYSFPVPLKNLSGGGLPITKLPKTQK